MRAAILALAALLACTRLGGARGDDDDEREVRVAGEPMTDEQRARLLDHARAGGLLWWRLPGAEGPRCEAWRLVPDPADPERGRLLFVADPAPADLSSGPEGHAPEDTIEDQAEPAPSASSSGPSNAAPSAVLAAPVPSTRPILAAPAASASSLLALAAWPLLPAPDPPAPSDSPALVPALGSPTLQLAYRLAEGHLTLTAPELERPVDAPPGEQKALGHALTCVFTGVSLTGPAGTPGRLILAARERFFFSEAACKEAGFADDSPGPDELRTVGCAGALADPATRARLERPPAEDAANAAPRLHHARALHHLRRGSDGVLVCDVWRNRPERAAGHGRLEHRGRDERGRFVRSYAYDVGPGYLTLQGPAEYRRLRVDGRPTDVVRASSCLVTRGVLAVGPTAIDLGGGERWYLSRRACDEARIAGAAAPLAATPLLVSGCE
ncbi:hypothetical protein [Nannocystis radixulma]|uniref:Uncharacterized protein n=1 Tax=Nannocystis radixulma TaxID=2995305 RepID=A0ABT5B5J4_9BACT|nr:hypothetical protein [Nannocystis radixulma]MDC0669405.1 hypothetical protein [Nannocystis radixulma]